MYGTMGLGLGTTHGTSLAASALSRWAFSSTTTDVCDRNLTVRSSPEERNPLTNLNDVSYDLVIWIQVAGGQRRDDQRFYLRDRSVCLIMIDTLIGGCGDFTWGWGLKFT